MPTVDLCDKHAEEHAVVLKNHHYKKTGGNDDARTA